MGVTRRLDDVTARDAVTVGGKAASLGEMLKAGLPVPSGFVVPASVYAECRLTWGHGPDLEALVVALRGAPLADVEDACAQVRAMVASIPIPAGVEDAVDLAYRALCASAHDPELAVTVRSSSVGEDSAGASFAGEHDTYLWVRGSAGVVDAMRRCWASLYTSRAIAYRSEMGLGDRGLSMGVVVQAMVVPTSAGVAFTLNPSNGDRSVVAIDSAWGFGEAVVSGETTPDHFLVDKVLDAITHRTVSDKEHEFRLVEGDRILRCVVEEDRRRVASLTDAQIVDVARMARTAERHAGCPQDVEWALAPFGAGEPHVVLLQSRPETVWSRMPPRTLVGESDGDPMSSIVSTLLAPLHTRSGDAHQP